MSVFSICEDAFNSINEELPTMSFETLVSLSYLKSMAMHELQENLKDIADYK
jgi:ketol-acid reductoisomerase